MVEPEVAVAAEAADPVASVKIFADFKYLEVLNFGESRGSSCWKLVTGQAECGYYRSFGE